MRKKNPAGNIKWHREHTEGILIIEIVMCLIKSHHLPGGLSLKPKILHRFYVGISFQRLTDLLSHVCCLLGSFKVYFHI